MTSCLVVDDSKVVRKVARRMLEDMSFTVTEAGDGQEALTACQAALPDVILLDWNMPVMDGMEFFRNFRQLRNADQTKVIFCTTENEFAKIQQAIMEGASEYIMKPFDADILKNKLMQAGVF